MNIASGRYVHAWKPGDILVSDNLAVVRLSCVVFVTVLAVPCRPPPMLLLYRVQPHALS
jgi:hypothetical protein